MLEYKVVSLAQGLEQRTKNDDWEADEILNHYARLGWRLKQVVGRYPKAIFEREVTE